MSRFLMFVSLFAFCFAITMGVVWEIYEFSFDGLLGLNMQKFRLESGEALIGRAALADTMEDLIVDAAGALVMAIIGFFNLKRHNRRAMGQMLIRSEETDDNKKLVKENETR